MAKRCTEPWAFDDGPEFGDRVLREYARWRLASLPRVPDKQPAAELVEGYRRVDDALAEAVRKFNSVTNPRLITTRAGLQREARIAWAVRDVVHRHLVAIELNQLQASCDALDDLRLTLMAEHNVEKLLHETWGSE